MARIFFTALFLFTMSAAVSSTAFARTQPIQNIHDRGVYTSSGQPSTAQQVRAAIIEGATAKGWQVTEVADGHLVAQIFVRSHMAQVDITYDEDSFSIVYKDSTNLLYDGTVIHRSYNKWITYMIDKINIAMRKY